MDETGIVIRFPGTLVIFVLLQIVLIRAGFHPAYYSIGTGLFFSWVQRPGFKSTHLRLMLTLRTRGVIVPAPHLPNVHTENFTFTFKVKPIKKTGSSIYRGYVTGT
jgi:hypothetical protein